MEGHPGQPFDPQLMISIWVYGLSRGISSARELSEWCDWEPGLQWLCAMETVNYHSLSDFRVQHEAAFFGRAFFAAFFLALSLGFLLTTFFDLFCFLFRFFLVAMVAVYHQSVQMAAKLSTILNCRKERLQGS